MSSVSRETLHCLCACPDSETGKRLLTQLTPAEPVLLLGKAAALAAASHPQLNYWIASGATLYALEDDLQAYAVHKPHATVTAIDYAGWVSLSERYRTQLLWR